MDTDRDINRIDAESAEAAPKSVGTLLREARLAKHLSLADIEKGTSIHRKYLEAVEHDEYEKTPGGVFLKGMIRNYGNYVGLDGLALLRQYKESVGASAGTHSIREVDKVRLNIQLKEKRDIGSGTGRMELPSLPVRQIAAGLAVIIVLALGYFAIPRGIAYWQEQKQNQKQKQQPAIAEQAAPLAKTAGAADGAAPAPAADKVRLEMEAAGRCWLEVHADGKEVFAGMLQEKDRKIFEAEEKLYVKYGNIGVMKLVYNGQPVDLKGQHGVQAKTYTLTQAVDAEVAPAPTDEQQEAAQENNQENKQADVTEAKPAAGQEAVPDNKQDKKQEDGQDNKKEQRE